MARSIQDSIADATKIIAILVMAFFVYASTAIKSRLHLVKEKQNVIVEFVHTPKDADRWIYFTGTSPVATYSSLHQSEGKECAVIHRIVWRGVHQVGILEVRVDVRDSGNKVLETLNKKVILGPDLEQH